MNFLVTNFCLKLNHFDLNEGTNADFEDVNVIFTFELECDYNKGYLTAISRQDLSRPCITRVFDVKCVICNHA